MTAQPFDPESILRHGEWLRALALALLRDPERADDLVQETWVRALERPPGHVAGEGRLRAWLGTVARNLVASRARGERHRRAREQAAARRDAVAPAADVAQRVAVQRELVDAVAALEPDQREVVCLRYFDGLAPREIARRLQLSGPAVRSRLSRGLGTLRARLDAQHGERSAWAGLVLGGLAGERAARAAWTPGALLGAVAGAAVLVAVALLLRAALAPEPAPVQLAAADAPALATRGGGGGGAAEGAELRAALPKDGAHRAGRSAVAPDAGDAAPPPAAAAAEPTAAAPAAQQAVVEASFVDADGAPLPDAELLVLDGPSAEPAGPRARAGADGRVALVLPLEPEVPRNLALQARAAGRVWKTFAVRRDRLGAEAPHYLGRIELGPGGAVGGRVVDAGGRAVAGAQVYARRLVATATEAERDTARAWGSRHPDLGPDVRPLARTGADGRYRLDGLPVGFVTVFARAEGTQHAFSERAAVRAGELSPLADLVLAPPAPRLSIAGRVTGPDGAPATLVSVGLEDPTRSVRYASSVRTDADGRFVLLAAPGLDFAVVVRDPQRRWRERVASPVRAGAAGLELAFGEERWIDVSATCDGAPVDGLQLLLLSPEGRGLGLRTRGPGDAGGVGVAVPDSSFVVQARATGFQPQRLGPFEPTVAPAELRFELTRASAVAGRVLTAAGEPASGARVHAHAAARVGASGWAHFDEGFLTRFENATAASADADEAGRFRLPLVPAGDYVVHAEAEGCARASAGPVAFVPGSDVTGLELVLGPPGALAGRVRVAAGVDPRGTLIGATAGDGHVEVASADARGAYRFDGLAPGSWQVHRLEARNLTFVRDGRNWPLRDEREVAFDVVVRAGETATFDIDLTHEVPCQLELAVLFNGRPAEGWSFWTGAGEGPLDTDGACTVPFQQPGRGAVVLRAPRAGNATAALSLRLDIAAGTSAHTLALDTAELVLLGLPAAPVGDGEFEESPPFAVTWEGDDGLAWQAQVWEREGRAVVLRDVPAGAIAVRQRPERAGDDPRHWPARLELELAAGESRRVALE